MTTGRADDRRPRPLSGGMPRRPRLDRVQDLAAGRRLGRPSTRPGRPAGELDVFDAAWMQRPPDRPEPATAAGPALEALTAARRARPPRAGQVGRPRGPLEHVPPSGGPRQGGDAARPRDRRPVHPGPRGRLARGRARRRSGSRCPPIGERIDRLESAVRVIRALPRRRPPRTPGVTRDDPFYPLRGAVNLPAAADARRPADLARRPEAARASRIAARARRRLADCRPCPSRTSRTSTERRTTILREMEAIGRDPTGFAFAAQVATGEDAPEPRHGPRAGTLVRAGRGDPPDPRPGGPPRSRRAASRGPRGRRADPRRPRVSATRRPSGRGGAPRRHGGPRHGA